MLIDNTRIIASANARDVANELSEGAVNGSAVPLGSSHVVESSIRIQNLAYLLWQERGSPIGSPDEDWFEAARMLNPRGTEAPLPLYALGIERSTS